MFHSAVVRLRGCTEPHLTAPLTHAAGTGARPAFEAAAAALSRVFGVLHFDVDGPLPLGCGAALYEALAGPLVTVSRARSASGVDSLDSGSDDDGTVRFHYSFVLFYYYLNWLGC